MAWSTGFMTRHACIQTETCTQTDATCVHLCTHMHHTFVLHLHLCLRSTPMGDCICMCVVSQVHVHVTYSHTYIYICIHAYRYRDTHIHMYLSNYVCPYMCTYIYVHTYVYIYIEMHNVHLDALKVPLRHLRLLRTARQATALQWPWDPRGLTRCSPRSRSSTLRPLASKATQRN